MKVYCSYDRTTWNVGGYDPSDSWSRDSYDGDYQVTGVSLSPGMRDEFETPAGETVEVGDDVWVAYVVYQTGDTFGHNGGYSSPLVVTKDYEVAKSACEWAETVRDFGYCQEPWAQDMENPPYPSWWGYFERIQAIRLEQFTVGP